MPALSSTESAAQAFEDLRHRWAATSRDDRKRLGPYIQQLRTLYAEQPVARQADLYLAWVALEQGQYEEARQLAAQAGAPHPGNVRLLAQLLEGATLSRSGEPEKALQTLLPLVGQLVDAHARALLHEEAVISAITAQQWRDALWLLDVWLRDVPEDDRQSVLDIVKELIKSIPSKDLERELGEQMSAREGASRASPFSKLLARQLATTALAEQDSGLARRLLERPGILPLLGGDASALLELAARFDVAQVNGRQVGLYVADDSPTLAERSAQISLGALEILRGRDPALPRLVLRQGATTAASSLLATLDAEGVSVLIGGTHPESAEQLARFAESEGIAALLLVPPATSTPHRWAFLFGPDEQLPAAQLLAALTRQGAQRIALLGAAPSSLTDASVVPPADCVDLPAPDQLTRYPVHLWKARGVDALLVMGSARCARDALDELRAAGLSPRLALGPAAAELVQALPTGAAPQRRAISHATYVGMGCYPSLQTAGVIPPEGLAGYWRQLARDAALIASQALAGLPEDRTLDINEVRQRRERVRAALESASPSPCMSLTPGRNLAPAAWHLSERR